MRNIRAAAVPGRLLLSCVSYQRGDLLHAESPTPSPSGSGARAACYDDPDRDLINHRNADFRAPCSQNHTTVSTIWRDRLEMYLCPEKQPRIRVGVRPDLAQSAPEAAHRAVILGEHLNRYRSRWTERIGHRHVERQGSFFFFALPLGRCGVRPMAIAPARCALLQRERGTRQYFD